MRNRLRMGSALLLGLALVLLAEADAPGQAVQLQPGGRFGFAWPNFTGRPGAMTPQQFVQSFEAAMHHPNTYRMWIKSGTDIRRLNPAGYYFKHLNMTTIEAGTPGDHPDFDYVIRNRPEWVIRDRNGNPAYLFGGGVMVDFANDEYLDWVLGSWLPNQYLDSTDRDPSAVTWHVHDNGHFYARSINCAAGDAVCARYTTDEGVQTAWIHMLDRFKAAWPNKRIVISSGPLTYRTVAHQMAVFRRIYAHADGYYSEYLTNDHAYWGSRPNDEKRAALLVTMQLASWLAANDKVFFPNLGLGDGIEPTQTEVDYAWAFFGLMREGDRQFFSRVIKDPQAMWQPRKYPEMDLVMGQPVEAATEISPSVFRRSFERAIAYVNISDRPVSIALPPGPTYKNSRGQTVGSPLILESFKGLTLYERAASTSAPLPERRRPRRRDAHGRRRDGTLPGKAIEPIYAA